MSVRFSRSALVMRMPTGASSPANAPTNSPTMVPITASPAAMRRPVTMEGMAHGSSSFHHRCRRVARFTWKSSTSPGSVERIPSSVAASTGNSETITALAIEVRAP